MKCFTLLALAALPTSALAQQCDLIDDNFDSAPLLAQITALPGWTSGFGSIPTIQLNGVGSRSVALNTAGFGGSTFATRSIPVSMTGEYEISTDVEVDGGTVANLSLDCESGVASQVIIQGNGGGYTVSSLGSSATVTVTGGSVQILYRVDDAIGYELFVNGALFETAPWPPTLCATRPSVTISAPLTFTGGFAYFDNLCMTTFDGFPIGTNYCMANPNSTGQIALISAVGNTDASLNDVELRMGNLPSFTFAYFLVSDSQGFITNPGGSSGNLCLSGAIGRFIGPGQVQNSGSAGEVSLPIDLTNIPQPNGSVAVMAGDTWNFQGWHRDMGGTSNFSEGLEINFN